MTKRLFLAGATGVIGRRLTPMLQAAGWSVTGMTRSEARADALRAQGVEAMVGDAFDADRIAELVMAAAPDAVVHQMTDLPQDLSALDAAALQRNATLREVGTRNLVAAAERAEVRRLVAQSIAFSYAQGPLPHAEDDRLLGELPDPSVSAVGVLALERAVLGARVPAVVLRYGRLYGPGSGHDVPWGASPVHVDAAAHAAVLALEHEARGVFNVAKEDGETSSRKARDRLGWSPDYRWAG